MIRPFTFLCFLLACASGLYLYQSKHKAQVLDHQIEQTVHQTEAAREQVRLLNAEWMLLNDPDRLRQLATQFLTLHTVSPNQFTTMAELEGRLPPVALPPKPAEIPMADAGTTPAANQAAASAAAALASDQPAAPAAVPLAAVAPLAVAPRPAPAPAQLAERKTEPAAQTAERRPAPPAARPVPNPTPMPGSMQVAQRNPIFPVETPRARPRAPLATPVAEVTPIQGGSALGMAQHGSLPPPRPISLFPPADGH